MKRLAVIAALLAACSSAAGSGSTVAATTTGSGAQPSTIAPAPPAVATVSVRLSDIEARAATGATVQVGQTVRLAPGERDLLLLPFDRPVTLAVHYVVDETSTGPAWTQEVQAAADGSTELIIEQPWRRTVPATEPIVMAWQAAGDSDGYLEQLAAAPGLTVTSPKWWTLDDDGLLVGETDPHFVAAAHDMGIEVWPYVTNGFEPARTRKALADEQRRSVLVAQLSGAAQLAGADGINVDFEAFSFVDRDHFTAFVAQLGEFVHSWGGVVSVDITVRTRNFATLSEARANLYDRRALAEAADYLALMAYDEHTTVRPSGPTASQAWTEDAVHWLLRYADPHQILLGIPLYARIWDPEDLPRPQVATIGTVVELSRSHPRTFDPEFGIDRVDIDDGTYVWAEDYDHLAVRMAFAREAGLAGTALWRLGFDTPEVWPILAP